MCIQLHTISTFLFIPFLQRQRWYFEVCASDAFAGKQFKCISVLHAVAILMSKCLWHVELWASLRQGIDLASSWAFWTLRKLNKLHVFCTRKILQLAEEMPAMMLRRNKLLPVALLAAGGNKNSSWGGIFALLTFKVVTRPEGCQKGSVVPPVSSSTFLRPPWSKGPRIDRPAGWTSLQKKTIQAIGKSQDIGILCNRRCGQCSLLSLHTLLKFFLGVCWSNCSGILHGVSHLDWEIQCESASQPAPDSYWTSMAACMLEHITPEWRSIILAIPVVGSRICEEANLSLEEKG